MYNRFTKEILSEYDQIRDFEERELDSRKKYIYDTIPRIKEIDMEIQNCGLLIAKSVLSNTEEYELVLRSMEKKIQQLKSEKAILLTETNIPLSYLVVHHHCESCKDTGFVDGGEKCKCYKQKLINKAYGMSNLSSTLRKENFDYFDFSLFSTQPFGGEPLAPKTNMENIYKECLGFVDNFHKPTAANLLFYGNPGSGKTFMCNCIAKDILDKGKIVVYQTSFKILEILGDYKLRNSSSTALEASYQLLFDSDLLIIDDLGTELTNTFTNTELFNIINTRLINEKKMLISTNLSPNEISDIYSSRLSSRVFGAFTFLKFYGKDLRWEK